MTAPYQIVIGLEVHVQLLTASKLFCGCSTRFGAPPNTQTCPVCIGLPGTLPVLNRRAVELAMRAGLALHCRIGPLTRWDRKNYYYPDLPKGYQISQYDQPLCHGGYLEIAADEAGQPPRRIGIVRAHLEEDAGKSMHDEAAGEADSRIDLNRAGTPLLEIVSAPDLRSVAEARRFAEELRLLLVYLGVSDCNMQEGSLRVDANVNLHVPAAGGPIATPIVEVKNVNSFRALERALAYEAQRQYEQWRETGRTLGEVPKQTRGWDDAAQVTRGQRHKEETSDYRYFPDPDLEPLAISDAQIAAARAELPELPAALRMRLQAEYGLPAYDADVLVNQGGPLVAYFEMLAAAAGDGKLASNWMQQDVLRLLKERFGRIEDFPVPAAALGNLLALVRGGELDTSRGRTVLARMIETGQDLPDSLVSLGIARVDEAELVSLCRELLAANPKIAADLKQGVVKAAGALVGQARQRNPNVNPARFRELCLELAREL